MIPDLNEYEKYIYSLPENCTDILELFWFYWV